jgi:hypothetical protein
MKRLPAFSDRMPEPVLFVVAALLAAAILVVYLQHRAITSLRHEAEMVVLGVSESAASFRLQFFPEGIRGRMAPAPPSPLWSVVVGPSRCDDPLNRTHARLKLKPDATSD